MAIIVYNMHQEEHEGPNSFNISRDSVLGNPFTHLKGNTRAKKVVKTREDAIRFYSEYFDIAYGSNEQFKSCVDYIYEKYKSGEDVYLGCYCVPLPCHGDVIKRKLESRLMKEKTQEILNKIKRH